MAGSKKAKAAYRAHMLAVALLPELQRTSEEAGARFGEAVSRLMQDLLNPFAAAHLLRTYADAVEAFAVKHDPNRRSRGRPRGSGDYDRERLRARIREIDALSKTDFASRIRHFGFNNDTALAAIIKAEPVAMSDIWRKVAKRGAVMVTTASLVRAIKRERAAMAADAGKLFGLSRLQILAMPGQKIEGG